MHTMRVVSILHTLHVMAFGTGSLEPICVSGAYCVPETCMHHAHHACGLNPSHLSGDGVG